MPTLTPSPYLQLFRDRVPIGARPTSSHLFLAQLQLRKLRILLKQATTFLILADTCGASAH